MTKTTSVLDMLKEYDEARWDKAKREISDPDRLATFSPRQVYNHELQGYPQYMGTLRNTLIDEEADEVFDALHEKSKENLLKELCDLVYVAVGTASVFGLDFDTAFNRVHANNMERLRGGHFREDGKLVKPESAAKVDLSDCVGA